MKGLVKLHIVAACIAMAVLAGCSSWLPGSSGTVPDGGTAGDTTCFYRINDDQRKKLQEIVSQPGGLPPAASPGVNTSPTICVLEEVDGDYREHYYTKESAEQSGFKDFPLYVLMLPQSASLMSHSLIPGPLKTIEVVVLGSMICVTSTGVVYQPYSQNGDGSWTRKQRTTSMVVKKVVYGAEPPEDRQAAYAKPLPAGYKRQTLPGENKGVLQRNSGAPGVPTVMLVPSASAAPSATTDEDEGSSPRRQNTPPTGVKVCSGVTPYGTFPNCRAKP